LSRSMVLLTLDACVSQTNPRDVVTAQAVQCEKFCLSENVLLIACSAQTPAVPTGVPTRRALGSALHVHDFLANQSFWE